MRELRDRGTTYRSIANILNEEGYLPYKGKQFSESSVCRLLGNVKENRLLTPRAFCESIIRRAEGTRPSYPVLAAAVRGRLRDAARQHALVACAGAAATERQLRPALSPPLADQPEQLRSVAQRKRPPPCRRRRRPSSP